MKPWKKVTLYGLSVAMALTIVSTTSYAQSFSSGSDGSDGALTLAANQGTIIFNPFDTARWGKVLDPDGDGVYNFTTITINSGSTLKLQGDKVNRPLYWLASGNVVVGGVLDLSGAIGGATNDLTIRRQLAVPGSGGYAGGTGGSITPPLPPTPGEGPGGGSGGVHCLGASDIKICGKGGTFTGNRYLLPLVGGSGGEGGLIDGASYYAGGAGGGAILLASSTSISLTGTINAFGGVGPDIFISGFNIPMFGGGGSGGAIRLVAPTLAGGGSLNVLGGGTNSAAGTRGWVRLEANNSASFSFNPSTAVSRGALGHPSTLRPASSIRVTAIDGIPVVANPSGTFQLSDATMINTNAAVNMDIEAKGIPPGTVVTLQFYPEIPVDPTTVNLTTQVTLTGTLQLSTATATFTFPFGFSRGFVRATWAP